MTEITDVNVKSVIEAAARSLARCEQCRAGLERKLLQKEFEKETIKQALDFLEEKGYLSDERYASSWVRTHCSVRNYGRIRLMSELLGRGIAKSIAQEAIDEYFAHTSEMSLCENAFRKLQSQGKDEQKIMKSLANNGFSYKIISKIIKENYKKERR